MFSLDILSHRMSEIADFTPVMQPNQPPTRSLGRLLALGLRP